jgi:hypothetical protein
MRRQVSEAPKQAKHNVTCNLANAELQPDEYTVLSRIQGCRDE